jgi:hypothetical protein
MYISISPSTRLWYELFGLGEAPNLKEQYNLSNEEKRAGKKCEASSSSLQAMIIINWATTPFLVIPCMSAWLSNSVCKYVF